MSLPSAPRTWLGRVLIGALAIGGGGYVPAASAQYVDVLIRPAERSTLASASLLNAVALAGARIVAVGQRGHVVYSDDGGKAWAQAAVPLSSDLVATQFPTSRLGWAVGHDGVVLNSVDAGATWRTQLDGRRAVALMEAHYRAHPADLGSGEDAEKLHADLAQFAADGPDKPFLDVWFENEREGFVVGAFGMMFRTEDAGQTWQPWLHRQDNPRGLHLYALKAAAGTLYAVGEQGLVLKLDRAARRFRAVSTPYAGTYFGVVDAGDAVVIFGLRGNVYRSSDGGANWRKVDTGALGNITAGTRAPDGAIHLVTQTGQVLTSRDGGASFRAAALTPPMAAGAVGVRDKTLIVAGRRGVRTQPQP